jgi:hypothetical protein
MPDELDRLHKQIAEFAAIEASILSSADPRPKKLTERNFWSNSFHWF